MFAARRLHRVLVQFPLRQMSSQVNTNEVWIVGASRTPVGSLNGALKTLPATQLGSIAIKHAVESSKVPAAAVEEVFLGQVIQAGAGQSPARQAALGAGLPETADGTTINKVCASGLKSIMLGAQQIQLGQRDVVVAGGMESMSNAPFLIARQNPAFGNGTLIDSMQNDGLWEVYNKFPMGNCAEHTAQQHGITRESADAHAIESYKRAAEAWKRGAFDNEIAPVVIKDRRGTETIVKEDEEYKNVKFDKIPTLKPVFSKDGIVTAANASNLNDGASAVVLVSRAKGEELGLKPLAKIVSYADAALKPIDFPIAPTVAIPAAIQKAGLTKDDIALYEINEAFSVVVRAAEKILDLDPKKINVNGGAVALGHAIGNSGSRIIVSLVHALKPGEYGAAGVCNGGGAASALVIQRL
ncbi:related to acetoacetyl-CoA thiolase [Serendipita indica DSM 11827]|uniref:acetyl-CoA C-acetyltransferase n=1 Tax=Serendipita indica (strain DSM 11827) TaxID=1109443 RepID=G4T7B7_SERID|nr:related to acetoacetyl-CoA thiolase [Serendipita indica DSM 11827]